MIASFNMKDINLNFYDTYFQPILWFQLYLNLLVHTLQSVIVQGFFFSKARTLMIFSE